MVNVVETNYLHFVRIYNKLFKTVLVSRHWFESILKKEEIHEEN